MRELHITNGDSAANLLKESALGGDVLPWRDPMHHGPFPAGLDLDGLSQLRARYLAGPGLDRGEVERGFRLRDDHLRAAGDYARVVLWFEHDLLDQLQLLQLLDWFSAAELGDTRLELICIDRFEGIEPFRGIGQLTPEQMASLHDRRRAVSPAQLQLARSGWSAFRSPQPSDLEAFLGAELAPLPFLRTALLRHLEDYPDLRSGLTRTERQILTLVAEGCCGPQEIFSKNMDFESALFIGDWATYRIIAALSAGDDPLLCCASGRAFRYPPGSEIAGQAFRAQRLGLTRKGGQVLAGRVDAFDLIDRDCWLGGVHLRSDRPMWAWDAEAGRLRLREP